MQVAHSGLIGYNTRTNYMAVKVGKDKIEMEIKAIEMLPHGDHLWQTKSNRSLQSVIITDANKVEGFYSVGSVTINKIINKKFINRKGYFMQEHELSDEIAAPIFRKNNERGLPAELPKIVVE